LWRIPLWLTLGALTLFGVTIVPDALDAYHVIHLPFWLTMGSIDDARAILSAMLGCVSTVLALIFSVALLVLSMVATLFGPRLLYRFLQDWVTQTTLGVFLGTFIYLCLVFLVTHSDAHSAFIPQISLITGWLLVVVSFGFLVFYSHRIAVSIQNPNFVARIVDDLADIAADGSEVADDEKRDEREADAITSAQSGYVQHIDHRAIVAAAAKGDAVVRVAFRPGQFVFVGETIAHVWPKGRAVGVAKLVEIGRHRVLAQDAEFGLAQIVEIGIRALSPAVNDSFTGVACVDWLGDALVVLADAPARGSAWRDGAGKVRLHVRPLGLARLAKMAFDQMRQAAVDNPAVLVRMLETFRRIGPRLPDDARAALRAQAEAIREVTAAGKLAKLDRDDIEAAFSRVI
jgi:uncharacterized membrane protein